MPWTQIEADYPYKFHLWGVPYRKKDVEVAVKKMCELYLKSTDLNVAMQQLIDKNEKVVSRCGMLMSFSGVLIVLSMYIVGSIVSYKTISLELWHVIGFYLVNTVWIISTIILLWSLKHGLPPPEDFHKENDFKFTAKLYVKRMGFYNIALVTSLLCFLFMLILLAPISIEFGFSKN